jgi:two-component system OmpR family sensor kinase
VFGVQAETRVIQVAQPMSVRQQRAAELAYQTLKPFALLLPALALLIWFAVGHALKPLQRLTALVKARRIESLEALPAEPLPGEVQPLVRALNELLARLRSALGRERAFMADAAHELRTPLTALHLQMGMLAGAKSESERLAAMETLSAGVQRAIRLIEQILSLARQEPRAASPHAPVRLDELARAVVGELVPLADLRHIDLGIAAAQPVSGQALWRRLALLRTRGQRRALQRDGGRVDVAVETLPAPAGMARVTVSDDGPGIDAAEHARVFDRFYRRPGTMQPGSGLGLAIVKTIAEAHGAMVQLGAGLGGRGLAVAVSFPVPAAAAVPAG